MYMCTYTYMHAKSLQSCPTLCNPIDGSPPSSPIPGILQARALEWVAISFSSAWKWKVKSLSCVWPSATPWTAAYQAPPSVGFSRQKYWSGVPSFLSKDDVIKKDWLNTLLSYLPRTWAVFSRLSKGKRWWPSRGSPRPVTTFGLAGISTPAGQRRSPLI